MVFILSLVLLVASAVVGMMFDTLVLRLVALLCLCGGAFLLIYYYEKLLKSYQNEIMSLNASSKKTEKEHETVIKSKNDEILRLQNQTKALSSLPTLDYKKPLSERVDELQSFFNKEVAGKSVENYKYFFDSLRVALGRLNTFPLFERHVKQLLDDIEKTKYQMPLNPQLQHQFTIRIVSIAMTTIDYVSTYTILDNPTCTLPLNLQYLLQGVSEEEIATSATAVTINVDETPAVYRVLNDVLSPLLNEDDLLTLDKYKFVKDTK